MKKHLIFKDEKSDKFWSIETSGKSYTVTYGKAGTDGQTSIKDFDTEAKCLKEAEKLVNEKLEKGYEAGSADATHVTKKTTSNKAEDKPDDYLNVTNIETHFGVTLPERLKTFIETREHEKYNDLFIGGLPNVDSDSSEKTFAVNFNDKVLLKVMKKNSLLPEDLAELVDEDEDVYCRSILPLSCLAKKTALFLAVRIDKKECPVYQFEDEAFYRYSDSFDDFLKMLFRKGDIPSTKKSWQILNKAGDLFEQNNYMAALDLLTDYVRIGLSLASKERFYELRGDCYRETLHYKEAEINFISGRRENKLVELYLTRTHEYKKAEDVIKIFPGPNEAGYEDVDKVKLKALFALVSDRKEEALKLYDDIIKKINNSYLSSLSDVLKRIGVVDKSHAGEYLVNDELLIAKLITELSETKVNNKYAVEQIIPLLKLPAHKITPEILHAKGLHRLFRYEEKKAHTCYEDILKMDKRDVSKELISTIQKDLMEMATDGYKTANSILKWFK